MKVRDIQKSHQFRESVKKWGEPIGRHRIFIAQPLSSAKEKYISLHGNEADKNRPDTSFTVDALYSIDKEIEQKRAEHEQLKSWIAERKALRHGLNNLGWSPSWINNKRNKTECELRVLAKLNQREHSEEKREKFVKPKRRARLTDEHVAMLPLINNPLPVGLAIIADYLQDNRLRLVDLFKKVDKNKDWKMTRQELAESMIKLDIPLNRGLLEELIITLDADNDDMLSYQELSRGIDVYYKDRRYEVFFKIF